MPDLRIGRFANRHSVLPIFLTACIGCLAAGLVASIPVSTLWLATMVPRAGAAKTNISPAAVVTPQITSFDSDIVAGNRLVIHGTGFSEHPAENTVIFTGDPASPPNLEASVDVAFENLLELNVPPGVGSGPIIVKVTVASTPSLMSLPSGKQLNVETSVSGLVKDVSSVCDPNCPKAMNVTVSYGDLSALTKQDGDFILALAGVESGSQTFKVNGATANPPYRAFPPRFLMDVKINRDNIRTPPIKLIQATNTSQLRQTPSSMQVGQFARRADGAYSLASARHAATPEVTGNQNAPSGRVTFEIPPGAIVKFPNGKTSGTLTRDVYEREHTPTALPVGRFSSTIVQVAPFGVSITPGAKLAFPNQDQIPLGSNVRLFRLSLKEDGDTAGKFVDVGPATVTTDKQRVEVVNPVTETGYYFVSPVYQTVTMQGYVLKGTKQPVVQAMVTVRGQSTLTNSKGEFRLRGIPVMPTNAQAFLRVDSLRANGGVDSAEIVVGSVTTNSNPITVPDIVLQSQTPQNLSNSPPRIYAPSVLTLSGGKTRDFDVKVSDPDKGQKVQVNVAGAAFAKLGFVNDNGYKLRVSPKAGSKGVYNLTITAVDSKGMKAIHRILLKVD